MRDGRRTCRTFFERFQLQSSGRCVPEDISRGRLVRIAIVQDIAFCKYSSLFFLHDVLMESNGNGRQNISRQSVCPQRADYSSSQAKPAQTQSSKHFAMEHE